MTQLRWLVTGCSSGLGKAFVRTILARGDKVVATARGDISRLSSLKEAGAETVSLDVTAPLSEIKVVAASILESGPIDVLVNNAGYIEAGMSEEVSYDQYMAQFETNFFGVIRTTQAILPHFREKKSGFVVFIGSSGGIAGEPGAGPYCATKFALKGWYDCFKKETAHLGIKSMLFELGFFRTKIDDPNNYKFRSESIDEYKEINKLVKQFLQSMDGNQPGDPQKGVEVMIDFVREEGVAKGRVLPERLPLGSDCLSTLRKRAVEDLNTCNEWEDVIRGTDYK
ncbi:NAD(P)-binding protein [Bimuria novae-zelandiae CBS 107.79]|uniref:NAD(P)-binding protein n=1 Tax=Bimuria novae-zelandiae CBS 107.79 TaxID=1447943 RepID=A0A6A5VH46_9PLEO|nr:NAD(P)-binding protein [Bimuria novae-zelandiae CBS 107.79]